MSSKVLVVFGAGSGLGLATAKRFGLEGFRVALVARRPERLDALVAQLAESGIDATAFPADLSDSSAVPALVDSIRARLGRIDAIAYNPVSSDIGFGLPSQIDVAAQARNAHLFALSFIAAVQAVLPEMRERDGGAILLSEGLSAAQPLPGLTGPGIMMAAARHYLYSLAGELAGTGVYAGVLSIGAVIEGSEGAEAVGDRDEFGEFNGVKIVRASASDIAASLWEMYTDRDGIERFYPAEMAGALTAPAIGQRV